LSENDYPLFEIPRCLALDDIDGIDGVEFESGVDADFIDICEKEEEFLKNQFSATENRFSSFHRSQMMLSQFIGFYENELKLRSNAIYPDQEILQIIECNGIIGRHEESLGRDGNNLIIGQNLNDGQISKTNSKSPLGKNATLMDLSGQGQNFGGLGYKGAQSKDKDPMVISIGGGQMASDANLGERTDSVEEVDPREKFFTAKSNSKRFDQSVRVFLVNNLGGEEKIRPGFGR
jgi:hypothetical protein